MSTHNICFRGEIRKNFLHGNICCGYSLEAPRRGASNEYHNICFCEETRKNINTFGLEKSVITRAM